MSELHGFSYLKLQFAEGFGDKSLRLIFEGLAQNNLSIDNIFELSRDDFYSHFPELGQGRFKSACFDNLHNINEDDVYALYQKMQEQNIAICTVLDDDYPKSVRNRMSNNAPLALFYKGKKSLFNADSISVVGSRNANEKTLQLTQLIAKKLAINGFNVVSGFAKGVDSQAHIGALENDGTTSMVLSFGLFELAKQKKFEYIDWNKNSLAISQFDLNERWRGTNAMTRNKLVCSLSKAVIIIEAGKERDAMGKMSGTFDAGRSALALNIPVFVISPNSECFKVNPPQGNRDLINLGGIEISSFKQILDYFEGNKKATTNKQEQDNSGTLAEQVNLPQKPAQNRLF